jgi:lipopolysaccharide export LptBFGC system permease protein LptF
LWKYTLEEQQQQERARQPTASSSSAGNSGGVQKKITRKKERTKMFHDSKRPATIHSMEGQNKKFVRYSLRPSPSSAVLSFEFWRRIRAHLVCFFLFCFFSSCLGFFLFLLLLLLGLFLFFLLLLLLGFFPKFAVKDFFFLVLWS